MKIRDDHKYPRSPNIMYDNVPGKHISIKINRVRCTMQFPTAGFRNNNRVRVDINNTAFSFFFFLVPRDRVKLYNLYKLTKKKNNKKIFTKRMTDTFK